jgi:hypothetical protein
LRVICEKHSYYDIEFNYSKELNYST